MTALAGVALGACVAASILAAARWLRVAQREHYLAAGVVRFAWRWWTGSPLNLVIGLGALSGAAAATVAPGAAIATAALVGFGPVGLNLRGRTSRLSWTRRLSLVAAVTGVIEGAVVGLGALAGGWSGAAAAIAFSALAVPLLVAGALAALTPVENRLAQGYVRRASELLARARPLVVGITGSYGKTTTKNYVAYLLGGERSVVASPRSFNNRAGLTRTVIEHLTPGTDVLVAEMGAYGPGEIADLCSWLRPEVAVITSIGPAHLERFGSLDRTLEAKAEITSGARLAVLNVDDSRLAALADRLEGTLKVVRASGSDVSADVAVLGLDHGLELRVAGKASGVARLDPESPPPIRTNAACAAAVALELGITPEQVAGRLGSLPGVPNRLQPYRAAGGYRVLDDTFNSNPAGARHALEVLASLAPAGRRMLVTPGMVELGREQRAENAALGEAAAAVVTDFVLVGRTNRAALLEGCRRVAAPPSLKMVDRREEAVAWAQAELGPGDVVLFENDLPDHFP